MSTLESLAGERGLCAPEWDAPKWWPGVGQVNGRGPHFVIPLRQSISTEL